MSDDVDFAKYISFIRTDEFVKGQTHYKEYKKLERHIERLAQQIFKQCFVRANGDMNDAMLSLYLTGLYHGAELTTKHGDSSEEKPNQSPTPST